MLTLTELIEMLEAAGVISKDDVRRVRSTVTDLQDDRGSVRDFIGELRKRHLLTEYQAEELCEGHPDRLVIGTYILLDRIGRGGMGQIFRARHVLMKRDVAIKFMLPPHGYRGDAVWRFRREVEAAAKLEHERIVRALDAGQREGAWYLVMEHVPGPNLRHLVRQADVLSVSRAIRYVRQVAEGLHYAHQRGVIHRDIKPSNILLEPATDSVKILDMGLASFRLDPDEQSPCVDDQREDTCGSETSFGQVLGTLDYMAPEQFQNARQAGPPADIYSLGCTLHFLLTGRAPRRPDSQSAAAPRAVGSETDLNLLGKGMPSDVERLLRRMIAGKLSERYATVAELLRDIDRLEVAAEAQQARPIESASTIVTQPRPPMQTAKPWLASALACLCLLSGGLWWMWPGPGPVPKDTDLQRPLEAAAPANKHRALVATDTAQVAWPVDLLAIVDPSRDTQSGRDWSRSEGILETGIGRGTRIRIPHVVPRQYILTLQFTRTSGDGPLVIGLVIADHHCYLMVDRKGTWGIGVDQSDRVEAVRGHLPLAANEPHALEVTVAGDLITTSLDGREITRWAGDFKSLKLGQGWAAPPDRTLFIATNNNARFRFNSIQLDTLDTLQPPMAGNDLPEAERRQSLP